MKRHVDGQKIFCPHCPTGYKSGKWDFAYVKRHIADKHPGREVYMVDKTDDFMSETLLKVNELFPYK